MRSPGPLVMLPAYRAADSVAVRNRTPSLRPTVTGRKARSDAGRSMASDRASLQAQAWSNILRHDSERPCCVGGYAPVRKAATITFAGDTS